MLLHHLTKTRISYVYTGFVLVSCKEQSKGWLLFGAPSALPTAPQKCPRVRKQKQVMQLPVTNKRPPPDAGDGFVARLWMRLVKDA